MRLSRNTLSAFDRMDAVFIEIDRSYRVVGLNRKAGRIFEGLSLGSTCYQAVTGKDQVCRDCPAKKVLDNKSGSRSGQIQMTVSGKPLFFDATASPVTDETGSVTGALLLLNDITLHKIREKKMADRQDSLEHIIRERTKALNEKEARLKQTIGELEGVIEALPGMVTVVDKQFNTLIANRAVVKKFGNADKNEVLGKKCHEVRKGILVPCPQCAVAEAFETGRLVSRYSTPGEEKQMGFATQSFAIPLKDDSGKIWAGVEVIIDITELRQVEKALKESQERLDLALESANEGIWDWNLETGKALFDARYYTISGYEPGEFPSVFEEWEKRVHPKDLPGVLKRIENCISGKSDVYDAEFRFLHKTGHYMWINGTGKVISRNDKGEPLRFVGTHSDITKRKAVEKSLRVTQFIFDKAFMGIFHVSRDASIIDINEQAARMLGYTKEELRGMTIFDIDPLVNKEAWSGMWQRLSKENTFTFETIHVDKNKQQIPVEITTNLIEYENHQFSINFVQDISERKIIEQRLRQSQKMEAIGTLAGGIAHDFNNILGAIVGCTDLIAMRMPDDCREKRYLDQILRSTHRAAELIQQILTFSRNTDVQKRPLKINLIVREVFKLLKATLPSSIEILLDADKDTGTIMADPVQIHQIIMNLGTNAAHAMENTGGRLELKLKNVYVNEDLKMVLSELNPGPFVKLTVADTGHGIPFDIQDQIFEPYFTTKTKGKGTGLGLSVVLGIVKTCEGGISLTSEPGKGTRIDIYFPRIDSTPSSIPKQDAGAGLPHGTERILIVDDEIELGNILGSMLEHLGYQVQVESDSLETLRIFKKNPEKFDLVISDLTMPKMTGDKLARALLKINPSIPILICSGFSQDITREDVSAIGVKDFLSKPLNIKSVAAKVHKALKKH